jgi:hypothetical protein
MFYVLILFLIPNTVAYPATKTPDFRNEAAALYT